MRLRVVLALTVLVAPSMGVSMASAGNGGNAANAKLCQKGGWTTLARSQDSLRFANQDECVSYAARGGTLIAKGQSQLDCESFSGIFSTDPATNIVGFSLPGYAFAWSCNGASAAPGLPTFDMLEGFGIDCVNDFRVGLDLHSQYAGVSPSPGVLNFTCLRRLT